MAENNVQPSGGNNALYFIVGGLVVVAVAAVLFFGGYLGDGPDGPGRDTNIIIESPRPPASPAAPAN